MNGGFAIGIFRSILKAECVESPMVVSIVAGGEEQEAFLPTYIRTTTGVATMSVPKTNAARGSRFGAWTPWLTISVVATLLGLVLPQMMPGETVVSVNTSKTDSKDKTSLEYNSPTIPEAPNFQGMVLRLGVGTVVVLGLCVSTLWGLRRWMSPSAGQGDGVREMRLIETLNLGSRCALHLVQLGKREVLVGVDSGGIKSVLPLSESFADVLTKTEVVLEAEKTSLAEKLVA